MDAWGVFASSFEKVFGSSAAQQSRENNNTPVQRVRRTNCSAPQNSSTPPAPAPAPSTTSNTPHHAAIASHSETTSASTPIESINTSHSPSEVTQEGSSSTTADHPPFPSRLHVPRLATPITRHGPQPPVVYSNAPLREHHNFDDHRMHPRRGPAWGTPYTPSASPPPHRR